MFTKLQITNYGGVIKLTNIPVEKKNSLKECIFVNSALKIPVILPIKMIQNKSYSYVILLLIRKITNTYHITQVVLRTAPTLNL